MFEPFTVPSDNPCYPLEEGRRSWDVGVDRSDTSEGSEPTVGMPCLARHGRWGNTVMQYAYLKVFAREYGLNVETPEWLGRHLIAERDRASTGRGTVVLDGLSSIHAPDNSPFLPLDPQRARARFLAANGRRVFRVSAVDDASGASGPPDSHVELEGLFMVHTRRIVRHREYLLGIFEPRSLIAQSLKLSVERLLAMGTTVVGVHVRRDDFVTRPMKQGFELITPMASYLAWLKTVWPTLNRPVLFLCSDSLEQVAPHFHEYSPVTAMSLAATLPTELRNLVVPTAHVSKSIEFYIDWHLLRQCDIVAVSNSTFSFTASLLSMRGTRFVRPTFEGKGLAPFDPWNSEPVLFPPPQPFLPVEFARRASYVVRGLGVSCLPEVVRFCLTSYFVLVRDRLRRVARRGRLAFLRELFRAAVYLKTCVRYD